VPFELDPRKHPTLSIEQAAEAAGISRGAAYVAARTGEMPTLRFGRRLRVPTAKLCEMLGLRGGDPDAGAA
jgi:excisionase family DNA binding protein